MEPLPWVEGRASHDRKVGHLPRDQRERRLHVAVRPLVRRREYDTRLRVGPVRGLAIGVNGAGKLADSHHEREQRNYQTRPGHARNRCKQEAKPGPWENAGLARPGGAVVRRRCPT